MLHFSFSVLSRQVKSVVPQRSMAVVHDLSTGQGITWLALLCGGVTLVVCCWQTVFTCLLGLYLNYNFISLILLLYAM